MKKQYKHIYYIIFLILYLEILTKIFVTKSFNNIIYLFLFSIPIIIFIYLLANIFKQKGNKIITFIITIILSIYYCFQSIFYKLFSNIFSFNTIGLAENIGEFQNMIFEAILKNIIPIILYLIPLILLIIFHKYLNFERIEKKKIIKYLIIFISIYLIGLLSLNINKKETYSPYNLYYNINSEIKTVESFGLATFTRIDIKRIIFGFNEKLTEEEPSDNLNPKEENPPIPEEIKYNEIALDFDELINNESNETIKDILNYFKNSEPTNKNEYTGMFKDNNIYFSRRI